MIEKNNNMGTVNISLDVVATIAGGAAIECYGVVGMASQKRLKDGYYDLLRKENYSSKEKEKIIKNALLLLQIKYNIKLKDNWKEIYNKLDF